VDSTGLHLCLPFSQIVGRKVDGVKDLFLEDYAQLLVENEENLNKNGQLKDTVQKEQHERFSRMIENVAPELQYFTLDCHDLYMKDTFDIMTADFSLTISRSQRVSIAQAVFVSEAKQNLPAKDMLQFVTILHAFVWVCREQILDLLRMMDYCQPCIGLEVQENTTDGVLCSSQVICVKSNSQSEGYSNESAHDIYKEDVSEQNETRLADIELEFEESPTDIQNNEEEAVPEETEQNVDSEKFGDSLVTAYCEEMFPSQEIVEKNGGLESWTRNANLLLSLAVKISEHSPALHYLRMCVDFSRIMCTANALKKDLSLLFILNDIGMVLRPEYLDHEESFESMTNQLIKPLEEDIKDHKDEQVALQKFSALFYAHCIDTNVDTSSVPFIVQSVLSLDRPELVMIMSPVVMRLLMFEEMHSPGIFVHLIRNQSAMEYCPCLQNIDEVFKDRFSNGLIHHDSYPAVMICDLIEHLVNFEDHYKIDDFDGSDCEVLVVAKSATKLVAQNNEDGCGLRVLSAIAFLRGFFKMFAKFVAESPSVLTENTPYVLVMTEVNSLLKNPKSSLQLFFLKQLYEHKSLFELQKWFGENTALPAMQELWSKVKYQDKAVFTSVFKYPEYEEAKAAYWKKLHSNDDSSMRTLLTKCSSSPNHAFALLGILINMIYLKRAVRKLTDKEEQLVQWFFEEIASFPMLLKELMLRIIGRRDFCCPELQLSPESSVEEVDLALLVLHIACVVATGELSEKLPMYSYFTAGHIEFQQSCVLAHYAEEIHSIFDYQSSVEKSVRITCACGLRLAMKSILNEKVCPECHEELSDVTECSTSPGFVATPKSYTIHEWELCTKQMNPAAYRALHFIVYSSFYAGISLGTSSDEKLSGVLSMLHGFDFDSDSTSPADFCFQNIESDLSNLMKILSCKKDVAVKTMRLVVEKSSDLIRSNKNDCSTSKMCREWEAMFSQRMEAVFNSSETSKELKGMIKRYGSDESFLGCRIVELDNYPDEPNQQNQEMKRLYRMTKQPSFDDFLSSFLLSPKHVQVQHSFLTLFLATFDKLPIIGNLHHLLKWSRLVSSALTHRISRKDAQSKSINDFINGHILELKRTDQETKNLKVLFENFKEAWNEMHPLVNQELISKAKMPRLVETDYIAYCLIESDYGVYLETAITMLVSLQNSILDAIISLSSSHHLPALSFLEKENGSGVMSVSIQDAKEKEIIRFQWSDDLYKYGQSSPEYGKGQEVTYDFERIEIWLAKEIAFGKCFLTGKLNKFIFAKELFHSCGPLLTEIRSLVKQNPSLPDEVRKGVSTLKERRIKAAQDLLQHMEVLIYLLKRKLKNLNVDMTLEEFAEKWSPMLPSPFPVSLLPEPRSLIKIKHVAALYEALEDVLADGAIDGLADKFRCQLPSKEKDAIRAIVDKEIDQLKPHNFLKALRRFVFRYLSSETERYWPEESTALQTSLEEPSLWSPLPPPTLKEIPKEMTLEYIHSIVKYLEQVEKVRFWFFRWKKANSYILLTVFTMHEYIALKYRFKI
jgi:hypothetical protein